MYHIRILIGRKIEIEFVVLKSLDELNGWIGRSIQE